MGEDAPGGPERGAEKTVRVILPYHLRNLARVDSEVRLDLADGMLTLGGLLEELERMFPALRGTIRETTTGKRRALVRFFACQEDFSHAAMETPLPEAVREGREPLMIVGAMAGG